MTMIVTLEDLAERLGVERSNARKIALSYGFVPERQRIAGKGRHQRLLVWSEQAASQIVERRRVNGFPVKDGNP
jgi:hypothetical protein